VPKAEQSRGARVEPARGKLSQIAARPAYDLVPSSTFNLQARALHRFDGGYDLDFVSGKSHRRAQRIIPPFALMDRETSSH
jgi:hypothetical protein